MEKSILLVGLVTLLASTYFIAQNLTEKLSVEGDEVVAEFTKFKS